MAQLGLGTRCVQAGYSPKNGEPRQIPIIQSTTFKYESSAEMGRLFDLEASGYFYSRLQNPTNDAVAARIAALEGGTAAMLTASGQAAIFFAVFNIVGAGDHLVSSSSIYGGSFNLFAVTMKRMGVEVTFVDPDCSPEELDAAFRPNTKAMYGETVANPALTVLDIEKFAAAAHRHGVPLIVDNTFATPINCRPFEWGADIVVHSTTKYMDGHAGAIGGAIVDSGKFDWTKYPDKYPGLCTPDESYHGVTYTERFGLAGAYITKATVQLMRDLGAIQSPQSAYYLNLGLESLHVRMQRHCENAQKVAEFLQQHENVSWVQFCGLPGDKYYELGQKYRLVRRRELRREGRTGRGGSRHGKAQGRVHRDACGRLPHLLPASGVDDAPADERRGAAGCGRPRGSDPLLLRLGGRGGSDRRSQSGAPITKAERNPRHAHYDPERSAGSENAGR